MATETTTKHEQKKIKYNSHFSFFQVKLKCCYVVIIMSLYWVFEVLPLAITALVPMVRCHFYLKWFSKMPFLSSLVFSPIVIIVKGSNDVRVPISGKVLWY